MIRMSLHAGIDFRSSQELLERLKTHHNTLRRTATPDFLAPVVHLRSHPPAGRRWRAAHHGVVNAELTDM